MRTLITLLVLSLFTAACQSGPADETVATEPPAGLEEARELLDDGQPFDALLVLDEVQALAPDDRTVAYLRGQAFMAGAELGGSAADLYLDAQAAYEHAADLGYGPDAQIGASRAARMNFEVERCLELARAAYSAYEAADPRPVLEQPLQRTLAEALFGAYVAGRQADEDAMELFAETEALLTIMTREVTEAAWAYAQLANLHQWAEQSEEAAQAQENVLRITPEDQIAHARAVELARAAGGSEAVLALYERFGALHPESALTPWYTGIETFTQGLAVLLEGGDAAPPFESAEALLVQCREMEPAFEASCKGYEVMCRNGVGWTHFNAGDLVGAQEAFVSMDELLPGGLDWQMEGSLLSGTVGLQFVADAYAQRGASEFDLEGKAEAAEVFDVLRGLRPEVADFANNAGFFHRDTCVILELMAQSRFRAAEGRQRVRVSPEDVPIEDAVFEMREVEVSAEEAQAFRDEAEDLRARAVVHAEKSYRAYQEAARMAPDDVRIVNDAALVMLYHIRKDLPEMEGLLLRAIEMGAEQTKDPELSADDLDALQEAWGDAHQNMGLVKLTLMGDPAAARPWFQRAFEIGPRPRVTREWITAAALPACDRVEAGEPDALDDLDPRLWLHVAP